MGMARYRVQLTRDLNRAFGAPNIEASAQIVRALPARADFLDISEALGLLAQHHGGNFRRYRQKLTLPRVVQRVLTAAYKESLLNQPKPIPLRIQINKAPRHSVQVEYTEKQIKVVLNRPDAPE